VCNYSLRGLPAAHRCPECGFEYDEHTQAWHSRGHRFTCVLVLSVSVFLLITLFLEYFFTGALSWKDQGYLVLFLFFIIVIIHIWNREPFFVVSPAGIIMRWGYHSPRTMPWQDIVEIEDHPGEAPKWTKLVLRSRKKPLAVGAFLRTRSEVEQLRDAVADGKARYLATAGSPKRKATDGADL
jgi:hypothetical protein